MEFPSDQHVGLVGVTLLGLGLIIVAIAVVQENAVIAAIGGVVQIGTGIVGFLGGRAVGRSEAAKANKPADIVVEEVKLTEGNLEITGAQK